MANKKAKSRLKHAPHFRFKGYLVTNDIRQHEIARLLGLSPATINQKLNGYLHFSFGEVEKICEEYGIMPDIFLTK